jgi:hypothetical protein
MLYCPKCGTANREGSRFCNVCAAALAPAELQCPMCGTSNPQDETVCARCGARLVPLVSAEDGEELGAVVPHDRGARTGEPAGETWPEQDTPETGAPPAPGEADWLSELRATVVEEEEEAPAAAEEWQPEGLAPAPPPTGEHVTEVEIPSWLARLEEEAEPATPGRHEALDWLRDVPGEAPSRTEERAEAPDWPPDSGLGAPGRPEEVEVPEWFQDLEPETPSAEPPAAATPAQEMPDWLRDLTVETPPSPPASRVRSDQPGVPDRIGWQQAAEETPPSPLGEEAPAAGPPLPAVDGAVPIGTRHGQEEHEGEWPGAPAPAAAAPVFVPAEGVSPPEPGELPDWLSGLAPREVTGAPAPPSHPEPLPEAAAPPVEGLVRAEIPDWLEALRPRAEADAVEEPAETTGLLEGLRGTLLASPAVSTPAPPGAPPAIAGGAASVARAELLQELLSRPAAPVRPAKRGARRRVGWTIQRLMVGLLLVAAIVVPMVGVWPLGGQISQIRTPVADDAVAAFATVEARVDAQCAVLMAFEYDATEAEEMDRIATALLRHLIERGARVILVSTRPEGPALAERLAAQVTPSTELGRVANLGYQPGQATGVQDLLVNLSARYEYSSGTPAANLEAMQGIASAGDVAAIWVLSGQASDLRAWVEQTSSRYPEATLLAGISARAEPVGRPYLEGSNQLAGIVTGLAGAAAYEAGLAGGVGLASFFLESLALAHLAVAGIMVAGAAIFAFGSRNR